MLKKIKKQSGFTLLELLIAISIFTIFSILSWQLILKASKEQQLLFEKAYAIQQIKNIKIALAFSHNAEFIKQSYAASLSALTAAKLHYSCLASSCQINLEWRAIDGKKLNLYMR